MPGAVPSRLTPGSVVGERYEVGSLLGRGGMAEVYAGTDRRLGRPVAVKLMTADMATRPEFRARFESEARSAASLSHPNAVAVYDTGEHEGVPYIVMERLPGETLADRMAKGPLEPEWVRTMAEEVLSALAAAHAGGLVHRDVKPANILLTADDHAKVADFGIAKSVEAAGAADLTGTGQLVGTPAYLAPERLDGAPATPQADLWAVGVVLYEALTGSRAFLGETPLAVARAVASGAHPPLAEARPDLDPALVATVERAMDPDPARRFSSADEMAATLRTPAGAIVAGVGGAAATVAAGTGPGGGDTLVLAEPGGDDRPVPAAAVGVGGRRAGGRRWLLWGILAAFLVLLVVLLARADDDAGPSPLSDPSPATTLAPATSAPPAPTTTPPIPAPAVTAPPAPAPGVVDEEGEGDRGEEGDEGRGRNGKGGRKGGD